MNNEPNLATPIAAGCPSTWGDKKALCEIEAKAAYERGETFSDNPYIENTWAHKWWEQTYSECIGHYKNKDQYILPLM